MTVAFWLVLPISSRPGFFVGTGILAGAERPARRRPRVVPVGDGAGGAGPPTRRCPRSTRRPVLRVGTAGSACTEARSAARSVARVLPARDPAQLPPRLPPRADASGAPQLDARLDARGPLPRWASLERAMVRGTSVAPLRAELPFARLRAERPARAGNLQMQAAVPFTRRGALRACRSRPTSPAGITVGKGVIAPHLERYVVQNEVMLDDLVRYHDIQRERIVVTGWPQTDLSTSAGAREEYARVRWYRLELPRPRSSWSWATRRRTRRTRIAWSSGSSPGRTNGRGRLPRCSSGRTPGPSLAGPLRTGAVHRWRPRPRGELTDLEELATLLQHARLRRGQCGNDPARRDRQRSSGCLRALRRGSAPGRDLGDEERHRRPLPRARASAAFHSGERFEDVVAGIERCLSSPGELAGERPRRGRRWWVVDGRASERLSAAIASVDWRRPIAMRLVDLARPQRGGHRRGAARVSPERRRRRRDRDRQPLGGRDRRDPRAIRT